MNLLLFEPEVTANLERAEIHPGGPSAL